MTEPLAELGAAALAIEAADEDVRVPLAIRVARLADRDRRLAVDRKRAVLRLPRAGRRPGWRSSRRTIASRPTTGSRNGP